MRAAVALFAFCAVTACDVAEQVAQQTVRQEAKGVVNGLVAEKLPGMNAAPVTDCIIDNASTQEILTIGGAAVTGLTPSVTQLVLDIAKRPDTVRCIAGNGFGVLGL